MEYRPGLVDEAKAEYIFLIYREPDGIILHRHQVLVLSGADAPAEENMVQEAKDLANRITGAATSGLVVLRVAADELRPGVEYRVDVANRRVVPHDPTTFK